MLWDKGRNFFEVCLHIVAQLAASIDGFEIDAKCREKRVFGLQNLGVGFLPIFELKFDGSFSDFFNTIAVRFEDFPQAGRCGRSNNSVSA